MLSTDISATARHPKLGCTPQPSKTGPRRPEMAQKKALSISLRAMHQRRASEDEKSINTNGKHSKKKSLLFLDGTSTASSTMAGPPSGGRQQSTTFALGGRQGRPLTAKRSPRSDQMGHKRTEHKRGSEGGSECFSTLRSKMVAESCRGGRSSLKIIWLRPR